MWQLPRDSPLLGSTSDTLGADLKGRRRADELALPTHDENLIASLMAMKSEVWRSIVYRKRFLRLLFLGEAIGWQTLNNIVRVITYALNPCCHAASLVCLYLEIEVPNHSPTALYLHAKHTKQISHDNYQHQR